MKVGGPLSTNKNRKENLFYTFYKFITIIFWIFVVLYLLFPLVLGKEELHVDYGSIILTFYFIGVGLYATGIIFIPINRFNVYWIYAVGSGYVPALISALLWPLTLQWTATALHGFDRQR